MNIYHLLLTILYKIYHSFYKNRGYKLYPRKYGDDLVSSLIAKEIDSGAPFMVSRFGAVEIGTMECYLGVISSKHDVIKYIKGESPQWWWNEGIRRCMKDNAGFFPNTDENLLRFGKLMIESMQQIDILTSWQKKEILFDEYLHCKDYINYIQVDPFWAKNPWTSHLSGKKVLVVHPFDQEIQFQYKNNREKLFENAKVLPEFELKTIKAVQSIGGNSTFKDWFEAFEFMKQQIADTEFDICLLGCGAYGMPLAAYVKSLGKQAIHIGGSLQLLFGIRGVRWEEDGYGDDVTGVHNRYKTLFNKYWIRPYSTSQIAGAEKVDNGCYW